MRKLAILLAASALFGAEFPEAEISNKEITAKFYLPDAEKGYYRGTRFDWSGQIPSLKYKGHEYFGQWFPKYDPKLHDAIMGPVEEFVAGNSSVGYDEAKVGETFIRIGVGSVRKPEEQAYARFKTYEIVDPGKWEVKKGSNWIEFTHTLSDKSGYGYVYRKRVTLVKDEPQMTIEHSLRNTGKKVIETAQYNHNFFMIDGKPTGPALSVMFGYDAKPKADLGAMAELEDRKLSFKQEIPQGKSVMTEITGFTNKPDDYHIQVENSAAGAGVTINGDRPIVKQIFWSIRTTACPEPYIQLRAETGREEKWTITYDFFTKYIPQ